MDVKAIATMASDLPSRYTKNLLDEQVESRLRNRQHREFCKAFAFEDSRIDQLRAAAIADCGPSKRALPSCVAQAEIY